MGLSMFDGSAYKMSRPACTTSIVKAIRFASVFHTLVALSRWTRCLYANSEGKLVGFRYHVDGSREDGELAT